MLTIGLHLCSKNLIKKNGTALDFNGDPGRGKNILFDDFIGKRIIGKKHHYSYVKDIEALTQKFNVLKVNKILVVADEVTFGGGIRENAKLKISNHPRLATV